MSTKSESAPSPGITESRFAAEQAFFSQDAKDFEPARFFSRVAAFEFPFDLSERNERVIFDHPKSENLKIRTIATVAVGVVVRIVSATGSGRVKIINYSEAGWSGFFFWPDPGGSVLKVETASSTEG